MAKKISIEQFLQAFSDQWEQEIARDEKLVSECYSNRKPWTNFMLNQGCFLDKVISRIDVELQRKPEWWHIDLSYVSSEHQDESSSGYFFNLPIMIEHENGDYPEEEMYNLIFHRCPLKVIIFRDYNDDDQKGNHLDWLNEKLQQFLDFLKTANKTHEEANSTQYLFIVWA